MELEWRFGSLNTDDGSASLAGLAVGVATNGFTDLRNDPTNKGAFLAEATLTLVPLSIIKLSGATTLGVGGTGCTVGFVKFELKRAKINNGTR